MTPELLERLTRDVLIADGAMGSMIARALPEEKPAALARTLLEVNLTNPEIVHDVHLQYIAAGADLIETNTFGASQARLDRLGLGELAAKIVSEAVKIAREARDASGRAVTIAGAVSPLDADWILDTNPDARRLYERVGFVAGRTERTPYLRRLFGFGASTEVVLVVP